MAYSPTRLGFLASEPELPDLSSDPPFLDLVRALSRYITQVIDRPFTFEQLRSDTFTLLPFIKYLSEHNDNPEILAALMVLKWHFSSLEVDDRGIHEARGFACEIVAWRFLAHLPEQDVIDHALFELPTPSRESRRSRDSTEGHSAVEEDEPLLGGRQRPGRSNGTGGAHGARGSREEDDEEDPTAPFAGLNALEIAVIAEAKNFLSQRVTQRIVNAIWNGEVIFWDSLSVATKKKAQKYNPKKADPYARLRVPKYQTIYDAFFLASFLGIYYAVLLERNPLRITAIEVFLYFWIAAFAYEEIGEYRDSGSLFYSVYIWNIADASIMMIAVAFLVARVIGLVRQDDTITAIAFDILSLEALLLFPRLCALLSLHPYFGTLIPCLKEMTKDFIKFLGIVIILYLGFLTCFTMLGRETFTPKQICWYLIYVFFGSSYMGFDISTEISPILGPPLMVVFVCMTNILLITSVISLLSNTLERVMDHAREEYLFQYSVFVLEASSSKRLTYFFPPMNLIPLILLRPLRLFTSSENLRLSRIILLKITHAPYVAAIIAYETLFHSSKSNPWSESNWQTNALLQRRASMPAKGRPRPPSLITGAGKYHDIGWTNRSARESRSDLDNSRTPKTPKTMRGSSFFESVSDIEELRRAVLKLSDKVEDLARKLDRGESRQVSD